VRRGFYDLAKAKAPIAMEALKRIAALYEIEARVRGKSAADRLNVRQAESRPLITELRVWFKAQLAKLPARGPAAEAIRYALNHWDGLQRFLEDGRIELDVAPANRHDTKAIVPVLRELADGGFRGPAMGDLGYRGKRLAEAGQALGITVEAFAQGRDGQFIPAGICWVVERSFAWLSRYRRLNTIVERSKEHLIAFVAIAFISILSRRLKRLVVDEISA
jgi:hypothetical protein